MTVAYPPASDRKQPDTGTYTIGEVAEKLQCSVRHVHRLVAQKRVPGQFRVGRLCRFRKHQIDRWLAGE